MDITVILITSAPSLAACPSVGLATGGETEPGTTFTAQTLAELVCYSHVSA